jgi:hypothetical protein
LTGAAGQLEHPGTGLALPAQSFGVLPRIVEPVSVTVPAEFETPPAPVAAVFAVTVPLVSSTVPPPALKMPPPAFAAL